MYVSHLETSDSTIMQTNIMGLQTFLNYYSLCYHRGTSISHENGSCIVYMHAMVSQGILPRNYQYSLHIYYTNANIF